MTENSDDFKSSKPLTTETYRTLVICSNCGAPQTLEDGTRIFTIPKGTTISKFFAFRNCYFCGCQNEMRRP